jgi:putative transposase
LTRILNTKFNPNRQRKSIRIGGYDYSSAGAYFVTMVTYQRDPLFGEIKNGEVILSDFGKIADECWRAIPEHFSFVELGAYVVMPNHVHGIVVIRADESATNGVVVDAGRGAGRGAAMLRPYVGSNVKPGSLGAIVRSYKSAVSYRIHKEHNTTGIWQRNYYEHIIRNEKDMQNKTDYINANPMLWDEDENNPINPLP